MLTSSAGNKPHAVRLLAGGFTLIELLVVLMVLALTMTAVMPMMAKGFGSDLKSAVRELSGGLRWARAEAIASRKSVALIVDTAANTYTVESRDTRYNLPEEANVLVTTVESEIRGDLAGVRFFPDGSATGGSIAVGEDGVVYEVAIDWLTGGVTVAQKFD